MAIIRNTRVAIQKTIQEEDYEPFSMVLESQAELQVGDNPTKVRKQMYRKLEKELDYFIDRRWDKVNSDPDEREEE